MTFCRLYRLVFHSWVPYALPAKGKAGVWHVPVRCSACKLSGHRLDSGKVIT